MPVSTLSEFHRPSRRPTPFRICLLLALLLSLWTGLQAGTLSRGELNSALNKLITTSGLGASKIAVAIYDPADSTEIYSHRPTAPMIPASAQKLQTAIAALHTWGPDHVFTTSLLRRGELVDGELRGDLVVKAAGDPSWVEEIYPQGPHFVFEAWADSLLARGVGRISGNVVAAVGLFPAQEFNPTWDAEDRPNAYAPSVSPFGFNGNMVRYDLRGAAKAGSKPSAAPKFGYSYFRWQNKAQTSAKKGEASLWLEMSADKRGVTLHGKLGPNTEDYLKAAVRDPSQFAVEMLLSTLRKKGIAVSGRAVVASTPADSLLLPLLYEYRSVTLDRVLAAMLKHSSGFIAETLLADLGPGTDLGATRVTELAAQLGIPEPVYKVVDGSGLSRQNRDTAAHLCLALCHAANQPWAPAFLGCLGVPGEAGTLEKRFQGSPAKDSVFAKTGTLTGVSNLAGYVRAADGKLYAFAIFTNGIGSVATAKKLQESICNTLFNFSGN